MQREARALGEQSALNGDQRHKDWAYGYAAALADAIAEVVRAEKEESKGTATAEHRNMTTPLPRLHPPAEF
jgi:hypothetical protein